MSAIEQALIRGPEYGSAEWHALPADDPRRQAALVHAADCWVTLMSSPHVADLLAEWQEWLRCKGFRDISSAVSAGADWRALATQPTYAQLERRRYPGYTPEQLRAMRAEASAELMRRPERRPQIQKKAA